MKNEVVTQPLSVLPKEILYIRMATPEEERQQINQNAVENYTRVFGKKPESSAAALEWMEKEYGGHDLPEPNIPGLR